MLALTDADGEDAIEALTDTLAMFRRPRGGDHKSQQRRDRDEALRALAELMGNDVPLEKRASDIAERIARYRPADDEAAPDRLLMHRIVDSGLPVPRESRLRRILRSG